jgi:hypothetical protein
LNMQAVRIDPTSHSHGTDIDNTWTRRQEGVEMKCTDCEVTQKTVTFVSTPLSYPSCFVCRDVRGAFGNVVVMGY